MWGFFDESGWKTKRLKNCRNQRVQKGGSELGDWERFCWKRNQERSKLAAACIELVISWSMWWWWAAFSRGCRHIAEPRKSLGSYSTVFFLFLILCRLRVAEFITRTNNIHAIDQWVDALTKPLSPIWYLFLRSKLNIVESIFDSHQIEFDRGISVLSKFYFMIQLEQLLFC